MIHDYVIIGGGVAGLSAAIRLTELGATPLLIESGSYPSHKVCGEFLSPECIPYLKKWGITPIEIRQLYLRTQSSQLSFTFPEPAGSLSHMTLDPLLMKYACLKGLDIRIETKVTHFKPKENEYDVHHIELSSGETLKAHSVLIATGRLNGLASKNLLECEYIGIKAHFEGVPTENRLEMFAFSGAYLGISPIENNKHNVACLAKNKLVAERGGVEVFMQQLIKKHPLLQAYLPEDKRLFSWMTAPIPFFGFKTTPNWRDAYFIGDGAATIPPATGDGLSMAILGGCMGAEFAFKKEYNKFKIDWHKMIKKFLFNFYIIFIRLFAKFNFYPHFFIHTIKMFKKV